MKSPIKHKRFRVIINNNNHYDFGLDTGSTYLDHKMILKKKIIGQDIMQILLKKINR